MTCTSAPLAISSGMRRCATLPPPTTTTFLPCQAQADEVGVLGHPASLEVAAAATKRVIACGCAGRVGVQIAARAPRRAPRRRVSRDVPRRADTPRPAGSCRRTSTVVRWNSCPIDALPRSVQRRVRHRDGVPVAQRQPLGEPRRARQHTAHRIARRARRPDTSGPRIRRARAHRAAASSADLLPHNVVGRQLGAELLGESAGQHQRRGAGRQRFGQRVELDDVGACRARAVRRARRSRS